LCHRRNVRRAQEVGPDLGDGDLLGRLQAGATVLPCRQDTADGLWQRVAVDLAVRKQRQFVQSNDVLRQHVVGQAFAKEFPQCHGVQQVRVCHAIGDQADIVVAFDARCDHAM